MPAHPSFYSVSFLLSPKIQTSSKGDSGKQPCMIERAAASLLSPRTQQLVSSLEKMDDALYLKIPLGKPLRGVVLTFAV